MSLAYSLGKFVEDRTGLPTHIEFDEFEYPKEKPFCTIKFRINNSIQLSKLRESIRTSYRFQFGLFANTAYAMSSYQNELRELFLYSEIPLYSDEGEPTGKKFMIDADITEVKMDSGALSDRTGNHRMYFDLRIEHVYNKRRNI